MPRFTEASADPTHAAKSGFFDAIVGGFHPSGIFYDVGFV